MYKTSQLDLDTTINLLLKSNLGFLLLQADNNDIYKILANESTYETRQGMYGANTHVTYHLYHLGYSKSHADDSGFDQSMYIETRQNAIYNIFRRWTDKGNNKHHAKSPYGCKPFMKYLDEIEWNKADYMLLMIN